MSHLQEAAAGRQDLGRKHGFTLSFFLYMRTHPNYVSRFRHLPLFSVKFDEKNNVLEMPRGWIKN